MTVRANADLSGCLNTGKTLNFAEIPGKLRGNCRGSFSESFCKLEAGQRKITHCGVRRSFKHIADLFGSHAAGIAESGAKVLFEVNVDTSCRKYADALNRTSVRLL